MKKNYEEVNGSSVFCKGNPGVGACKYDTYGVLDTYDRDGYGYRYGCCPFYIWRV